MPTSNKSIAIKDVPKSFWQGFWFMCIEHTGKLIALLLTIAIIVFFFYGSINTKWFQKKPIKILEKGK